MSGRLTLRKTTFQRCELTKAGKSNLFHHEQSIR